MKKYLLKLASWILTRYQVTICIDTRTGVNVDIKETDVVRVEDGG